jgi:neutral ceramidase
MTGRYEVGFGRADITAWEPDLCMLGWGMFYNRIEGVAEPLFSRAMVVQDGSGSRFAYVCADLLLISQAVRFGVLEALGRDHADLALDEARVMLTATHTHSAPAGYSDYFWIDIGGPGHSRTVLAAVVQGIVASIVAADRARRPGRLRFVTGKVPADAGIAFNRSWFAYSQNEGVTPVGFERRAEAVDATMKVLRFDPDDGAAGGMVSWFPLHGTCVHSENRRLHPDHKGLACHAFAARTGAFGIFAQEACGDVSPNPRMDERRGRRVGRFDDDLASAAWVASVEADHAHRLWASDDGIALDGPLEAAIQYVDFRAAPIDPRFAERPGAPATTRPAQIGISMALGTAEGPGPLLGTPWIAQAFNGLARAADALRALQGEARRHDPQWPLLDLALGLDGRLLGVLPLRSPLVLPVEPISRYVRDLAGQGALDGTPWVPQVVPIQVVRLGPLAIAALPFEPTTVAGRRLRQTLLTALAPEGVQAVVINPYANAYAGYLTTFEEYQIQHYEAGYTLFGPWELAAVRTALDAVAHGLLTGGPSRTGAEPLRIPTALVERQAYAKAWPAYGGT